MLCLLKEPYVSMTDLSIISVSVFETVNKLKNDVHYFSYHFFEEIEASHQNFIVFTHTNYCAFFWISMHTAPPSEKRRNHIAFPS